MAIVSTNPLVNGLSGMLGRTLVFKTLYGKTIVASRPRPPKTQSESQKANRNKFRDASRWARAELYNPARKAYYQKKARQLNLPNAYTAAITDYMRKPVVTKVTTKTDNPTYTVRKKDFALKQVTAQRNDGTPIAATATEPDFWVFEAPPEVGIQFSITSMNNKITILSKPT
jgi:hypothetical protein